MNAFFVMVVMAILVQHLGGDHTADEAAERVKCFVVSGSGITGAKRDSEGRDDWYGYVFFHGRFGFC